MHLKKNNLCNLIIVTMDFQFGPTCWRTENGVGLFLKVVENFSCKRIVCVSQSVQIL